MLSFCAYWEGKVKGDSEEFERYINEVHLPLVAKYPNLRKLRYLKGETRDGVAPKYHLSFELQFDSWKEFEVAKNSSERAVAVEDAKKLEAMFDGTIYHVVYSGSDFSVTA